MALTLSLQLTSYRSESGLSKISKRSKSRSSSTNMTESFRNVATFQTSLPASPVSFTDWLLESSNDMQIKCKVKLQIWQRPRPSWRWRSAGGQLASEETAFTRVRTGSNWREKPTPVIDGAQENDFSVKGGEALRKTDDPLKYFYKKKQKNHFT